MKRNWQILKVKQKLLGSDTWLRYYERFWTGGWALRPPPPAEEKKNLPALIIVKILLSQFNPI